MACWLGRLRLNDATTDRVADELDRFQIRIEALRQPLFANLKRYPRLTQVQLSVSPNRGNQSQVIQRGRTERNGQTAQIAGDCK